jgi:hypothetical protein
MGFVMLWQMAIHTAQSLVPEHIFSIETANEKLMSYTSTGSDLISV